MKNRIKENKEGKENAQMKLGLYGKISKGAKEDYK